MHLPLIRPFILALVFCSISSTLFAQEMSLDELTAKHIASVGSKDKIASIKNLFLLGDAGFKIQGSASQLSGKAAILSDKGRVTWALTFKSNEYPQDKFGFDGKKAVIRRTSPEGRSLLTQFINDNRKLLEDGILGGALSRTWAFARDGATGRMKVSGTKKVDGRETIVVDYNPKGGDFITKLYFDKETFRHVRSEHTVAQSAVQGTGVDSSAGQAGSLTKLTEEFSEFKKMGELNLPTVYKVTYSRSGVGNVSTQAGTSREVEWSFTFTDFAVDQDLGDDAFALTN
jgi:hypothetical protein